MTKFISVISGKGGTGKTTVAINLALALNEFGHSVILLDSDLKSADVGILLGVPQGLHTLHDVLQGKRDVKEVIYRHPSGLNFVPAAISTTPGQYPSLEPIVARLHGVAEMVIMDLPTGFHKDVASLLARSDEVLVVTNPELPAVTDAIKTIQFARNAGKDINGVVVNRYHGDGSEMTLENIREMVDADIISVIPEDEHVRKSVRVKYPVSYAYPLAPASVSFKKLAATVLGRHGNSVK